MLNYAKTYPIRIQADFKGYLASLKIQNYKSKNKRSTKMIIVVVVVVYLTCATQKRANIISDSVYSINTDEYRKEKSVKKRSSVK